MDEAAFNDLLNSYIDGIASDVDETLLFAELTSNQEYRLLFSAAMKIRSIARETADATTPSLELKESVFAAVNGGFSTSLSEIGRRRSAAYAFFPLPVFSVVVLLASLLVALAGNGHLDDAPRERSEQQVHGAVSGTLSSTATTHQAFNQTFQSELSSKPVYSATLVQRRSPTAIHPVAPPEHSTVADDGYVHSPPIEISAVHRIPMVWERMGELDIERSTFESPPEIQRNQLIDNIGVQQKTIEVGVRHFDLSPTQTTPMAPASGILPEHTAVSFAILVHKDLAVGVEIGQEAFLQQYTRELEDVLVRVMQYPALLWAGPFFRYKPSSILPDNFVPAFTLQGALAQGGFMARGSIGISYNVTSSLSFGIGYETAQLWYTVDGSTHRSVNNGWTYGLSLQL